jgi:hypothetical protein
MNIPRKTLTMKGSGSLWQAPSKAELIEQRLKDSAREILVAAKDLPANSFNEIYRKNLTMRMQLAETIKNSYSQLQEAVVFPTKRQQLFESITKNVCAFLAQNGLDVTKFQEALQNVQQPKEHLPKVALSSFRP